MKFNIKKNPWSLIIELKISDGINNYDKLSDVINFLFPEQPETTYQSKRK